MQSCLYEKNIHLRPREKKSNQPLVKTLNSNMEINHYPLHHLESRYYQKSKPQSKSNGFSKEHTCTMSRFSLETLIKRIKPLKTWEKEFENRKESTLITHLGIFFRLKEIRTKAHNTILRKEFFSIFVSFLIETFRDKFKPVVIEKIEFKNRDLSLLLASFGIFGLSYFHPLEQKLFFFNGKLT